MCFLQGGAFSDENCSSESVVFYDKMGVELESLDTTPCVDTLLQGWVLAVVLPNWCLQGLEPCKPHELANVLSWILFITLRGPRVC